MIGVVLAYLLRGVGEGDVDEEPEVGIRPDDPIGHLLAGPPKPDGSPTAHRRR